MALDFVVKLFTEQCYNLFHEEICSFIFFEYRIGFGNITNPCGEVFGEEFCESLQAEFMNQAIIFRRKKIKRTDYHRWA